MSAATKAAIAELTAQGLLQREIAHRLGISTATVSRHAVRLLMPCVMCGSEFRGRPDRITCGDSCYSARQVELRRARRHGRTLPADRLTSEPDRSRGMTVEEWLAERRPTWARDASPRADAWAGYSAAHAEIGP